MEKQLTKEQRQDIFTRFESSESPRDIAVSYNMKNTEVLKVIKDIKNGIDDNESKIANTKITLEIGITNLNSKINAEYIVSHLIAAVDSEMYDLVNDYAEDENWRFYVHSNIDKEETVKND